MPKMSVAELLPIWAENPAAFDAEPQHIRDRYAEEVEALRGGAKLDASTGKLRRPRGDHEAMPPNYAARHASRGLYSVETPDGTVLEGPENGKYDGKQAAADAAWKHYREA